MIQEHQKIVTALPATEADLRREIQEIDERQKIRQDAGPPVDVRFQEMLRRVFLADVRSIMQLGSKNGEKKKSEHNIQFPPIELEDLKGIAPEVMPALSKLLKVLREISHEDIHLIAADINARLLILRCFEELQTNLLTPKSDLIE